MVGGPSPGVGVAAVALADGVEGAEHDRPRQATQHRWARVASMSAWRLQSSISVLQRRRGRLRRMLHGRADEADRHRGGKSTRTEMRFRASRRGRRGRVPTTRVERDQEAEREREREGDTCAAEEARGSAGAAGGAERCARRWEPSASASGTEAGAAARAASCRQTVRSQP